MTTLSALGWIALVALLPSGGVRAETPDPNSIPDTFFPFQWPLHNTGQLYPRFCDPNSTCLQGTPDADIDWLETYTRGVSGQGVVIALATPSSFPTVRCLNGQVQPQLWENPGEVPDNGLDDDGNGFIDDVWGANLAFGNGSVCYFSSDSNHDTLVAHLAVAPVDGLAGVGVAPNARLMILSGWDDETFYTEALPYAESMGARVVVVPYTGMPVSGGGPPESDCAAAGTQGGVDRPAILAASDLLVLWGFPHQYPGCDPSAVGLGYTDANDVAVSSPSPYLDFAAPGERGWNSGVALSWALPIAAGTAALALERNPELDPAALLQRLRDGADEVGGVSYDPDGWNSTYGSGRINALGTLLLGDLDGDGIDGDGDWSGVVGDAPCATGQGQGCDDNCPFTANPDQADSGGIGVGSGPDGIGDACQCGDVNDDGVIGLGDFDWIKFWVASSGGGPAGFVAEKCDVGGSPGCRLGDFLIVKLAVAGSGGSVIQQVCEPAGGRP
jgi:hypothetical protein